MVSKLAPSTLSTGLTGLPTECVLCPRVFPGRTGMSEDGDGYRKAARRSGNSSEGDVTKRLLFFLGKTTDVRRLLSAVAVL